MISICMYAFSVSVNCPAVICSPNMSSILRRITTSELCTSVLFFTINLQSTIYRYCLLLQAITIFRTIHLILCFQQTGDGAVDYGWKTKVF